MAYVSYIRQEEPSEADQWADLSRRIPRPDDPLPTPATKASAGAAWRDARAGMEAYRAYAESGDAARLDAAIHAFRNALAGRAGATPQFSHVNNLANALVDRFELRWKAERAERESELRVLQRHHADTRAMNDFKATYAPRAKDLDEALVCARWAVWARSGDSPDAARGLATLRRVQLQREASGVLPQRGPKPESVNLRLAAMSSAPLADRVAALRQISGSRPGFRTSFEAIVKTLPRTLAWIGPQGNRRQPPRETVDALDELIGLALHDNNPARAVELFEAGRGVLWDRVVGHSAPAVVRAKAAAVARRMDRAADCLDEHGGAPGLRHMAEPHRRDGWERRADARLRRRRVRQQKIWDATSSRAHAVLRAEAKRHDTGRPEATFLVPDYARDILPAAAEGPVVCLWRRDYRILAFVVQEGHDAPRVLELGHAWRFDKDMEEYLLAIDDVSSETREQTVRKTLEQFYPMFRKLPWYLFGQEYDPADEPRRVWWCPSGLLATLPLHAVASFSQNADDSGSRTPVTEVGGHGARGGWLPGVSARRRMATSTCLLDVMTSSYTPTVRSLVWAREARDAKAATAGADESREPNMLLVTADQDSRLESLPGSAGVRKQIQKLVPPNRLTLLSGKQASVRQVLRAFEHHEAVHFDCHSFRDPHNPWRSGLVLHDRPLTVEDLVDRSADRLDFAYLAACATALTDEQLPDEMITLAATLHYTGCPNVIGTLTPSTDRSTARVTRNLYSGLISADGRVDPEECVRLLHAAVSAERTRLPDHPTAWSPFIHIGI
ncbi:CHAT domain-containing protein [Streptomyces griseoloalbus]|uniref:CHAT domain-containing protein n=1 Tax=Streptomyces griseoloalbus TaxID=67303 RepID=UPI0033A61229